jgi:hypothetical protein
VVTREEASVASIAWSPDSRYVVIQQDGGGLLLADVEREAIIPLHQLLPQLIASGDCFWSPSGRRLLFRAQGGVSSASFAGSSPLARSLERIAGVLLGRAGGSSPALVVGDYRERLALLDLAGQRLTTVALDAGEDTLAALESVLWTPDEREAILAGTRSDDRRGLWRLTIEPLRLSAVPIPGLAHGTPLLPLSWLPPASGHAQPGRAELREPVILKGDQVGVLTAGGSLSGPIHKVEPRTLAAGPDGGYRGVSEEEEETEDERPLILVAADPLESPDRHRDPVFTRAAGLLYLLTPRASALWPALDLLLREGDAVDLDAEPRSELGVVQTSRGGGVGRLVVVSGSRRADLGAGITSAEMIPLQSSPFAVVGPRSGLAAVAADRRRLRQSGGDWIGNALVYVLTAVVAAVLLLLWRRRSNVSR